MDAVELPSAGAEYFAAMKSVRAAKMVTWLLVWVALAVQVTCFILAQFTAFLEPPKASPATQPAAATGPAAATRASAATRPVSAPAPSADARTAGLRRSTVAWVLAVTKFAGPAAGAILALALGIGLLVSLVGRLGGAKELAGALFWSVFLLAMLCPWRQVFPGTIGAGVLFDFGEMHAAIARAGADVAAGRYYTAAAILHFIRFLAYPLLTLLVWIVVGLKFARGLRRVNQSTSVVPISRG